MCLRLVSFDESSSLTSHNGLPSRSWLLTNSGHNCWVLRLVNATEVCRVQIQVLHQWLFQERQWWLILSLCEGVPNVLLPCVSSSPVLHCNSFSWRFCSSRSYLKQIWFEILWSSAFQLFLKQLRHQLSVSTHCVWRERWPWNVTWIELILFLVEDHFFDQLLRLSPLGQVICWFSSDPQCFTVPLRSAGTGGVIH